MLFKSFTIASERAGRACMPRQRLDRILYRHAHSMLCGNLGTSSWSSYNKKNVARLSSPFQFTPLF